MVSSCMPPVFSELQSARTVGAGELEATAGFSSNFSVFDDEGKQYNEHAFDHVGVHLAYGLADRVDMRARLEYIWIDNGSDPGGTYNIFGMGPKGAIVKDRLAVYLPVGFAFGEEIEKTADTWQFHPTLLLTLPINDHFEFNPSGKVLIPINSEMETLIAFNIGMGLSTDLSKYAIRPEFGLLYNPGEEGHYQHFSLGVTFYPLALGQ